MLLEVRAHGYYVRFGDLGRDGTMGLPSFQIAIYILFLCITMHLEKPKCSII